MSALLLIGLGVVLAVVGIWLHIVLSVRPW